ncbi:unnamed protein product [Musa textilis]
MKASLPSSSLSVIHKKKACDSLSPPSQGCVAEAGLCSRSTLFWFEAVKASMGDSKEGRNNGDSSGWMAVPAFGDWDMKNGVPDYSMDFTKIREMRKQNKHPSRASLGNDDAPAPAPAPLQQQQQQRGGGGGGAPPPPPPPWLLHREEEEVDGLLAVLFRCMRTVTLTADDSVFLLFPNKNVCFGES